MFDKTAVDDSEKTFQVLCSTSDPRSGRLHQLDEYYRLASHHLRRWSLQYFWDMDGNTTSLNELSVHLAERTRSVSEARPPDLERQIMISLYHVHVPKLQQTGVIDFDERTRTIRYLGSPALDTRLESIDASR